MSPTTTQWTSPLLPNITIRVQEVTPAMAQAWLDTILVVHDKHYQRTPVEKRIQRYALDMAKGRWPFTGDPIRFSDGGHLIDGQHRLRAIVLSGITQICLVVEGLPLETIQTIDVGARRSFVNYLQMEKIPNARHVAATCTSLWHWMNGKYGSKGMARVANPEGLNREPTLAELWELFIENRMVVSAVRQAYVFWRTTNKQSITVTQLATFWMLATAVDPFKRDAFFAELQRDLPLDNLPGYPITTFCDRVRRRRSKVQASPDNPRWVWFMWLIQTWNAWNKGDRIEYFTSPRSTAFNNLPKVWGLPLALEEAREPLTLGWGSELVADTHDGADPDDEDDDE